MTDWIKRQIKSALAYYNSDRDLADPRVSYTEKILLDAVEGLIKDAEETKQTLDNLKSQVDEGKL